MWLSVDSIYGMWPARGGVTRGVNEEIVEHGVNGFLAQGTHEWQQALRTLLRDRELCQRMGGKGRELVEKWYSLQVQAPRLEKLTGEVLR